MNYLILTPDGVGSTLLQRSLTVYLNSAGYDYYNTHELLNGLAIKDNCLIKKRNPKKRYYQSIDKIIELMSKNKANVISRIANYHVENRTTLFNEDYRNFYKFCNSYYQKIFYCTRNPYEYALSWCLRNITNVTNVYSVSEKLKHYNSSLKYNINLDFFKEKLDDYARYLLWVNDNFYAAEEIDYNYLNQNIDRAMSNITGFSYSIETDFSVSFDNYSLLLYYVGQHSREKKILKNRSLYKHVFKLKLYQDELVKKHKMPSIIPIKMNTFFDKQSRINNFNDSIEIYNNWAKQGNMFSVTDSNSINNMQSDELKKYDYKKLILL